MAVIKMIEENAANEAALDKQLDIYDGCRKQTGKSYSQKLG